MHKSIITAVALAGAVAFAVSAQAQTTNKGSGAMTESKGSGAMVNPAREAMGTGVIHAVDAGKNQINITHDPIPAIGWPTMKMDLPVTNKVDLSAVKPGSKVNFTLKQGMDKQYRVIAIEPVK